MTRERGERDGPETEVRRLVELAGPRRDAPAEVASAAKQALRQAWRVKVEARREARRRRAFLSLAALLFLALGLGFWFREGLWSPLQSTVGTTPATEVARVEQWFGEGEPGAVDAVLVAGDRLATCSANRVALRLAGKQTLRLDTESEVVFGESGHLLLRRGAIYVDSGPEAVPLQVETPFGRVRDIGTQFLVRLENGGLALAVREGEILLEGTAGARRLGQGETLTVDTAGEQRWGETSGRDWAWDWVGRAAPEFQMEGRSAHEVLSWVARERGQILRYDRPSDEELARSTTASGASTGLTPDELLALILPGTGLRHRDAGRELIILGQGTEEEGRP